jgi:hypothetical protein
MADDERERWFEIMAPRPDISSIVVGKDVLGFRIDIHGSNGARGLYGDDTIQDRVSQVIRILGEYVGPESEWVDYETREPVRVWDVLVALSELEDF